MAASGQASYNRGKGAVVAWLRELASHQGNECVRWPFARVRNGYGQFSYLGKLGYAHRFMCELVNGAPPSPEHHASHSCGKGRQGCVNPRHLEWKTASENHLERRRHGTAATNTWGTSGKLSADTVEAIRRLEGLTTNMELARRFDVSVDTIRRIFTRETYNVEPTALTSA